MKIKYLLVAFLLVVLSFAKIAVANEVISVSGVDISLQNINQQQGSFDVVLSGVSEVNNIEQILVPVWSDINGQDDIIWYVAEKQSDGLYKISIQSVHHKRDKGFYHIHVYRKTANGSLVGLGSATVNVVETIIKPHANITIENVNHNQSGGFLVTISQVIGVYDKDQVLVPVWSDVNGQDDITWYAAEKKEDGRYQVLVQAAKHKQDEGIYHVHVYVKHHQGTIEGLGSTTTNFVNFLTQPKVTLAIQKINEQSGTFDIEVSVLEGIQNISKILVPVWSDINGQDDLVWYEAKRKSNDVYGITIDKKNHKNSLGMYHIHTYYELINGHKGALSSTTIDMSIKKSGTLQVQRLNIESGTFEVIASQVFHSNGVKSLHVPVWSEENGQDDLVWYEAKLQLDGTYKVDVDKKNHKNSTGVYQLHLYYKLLNGQMVGITSTKVELTEKVITDLRIRQIDQQIGHFEVIVSSVQGIVDGDRIVVPVWSEVNGQDDIIWYGATKQLDGTYRVSIQAKNHKYNTGIYHIHTYLQRKNGNLSGLGNATTFVELRQTQPKAKINIENLDNTNGLFDVVISDVLVPTGITKVFVPVWSDINGQNDIIWYEAREDAMGNYRVTVRLANHKYETGIYHAHLYIESSGKKYGLGSASTSASFNQKSGRFFIDVSSHNGELSVADYRALAAQGISGVVVKLTEYTTYRNPLAESQIRNAQAAGLKVSVYHYSHFTSAAEAQAEARYFVKRAKELGLSSATVMVNDIEEDVTRPNINANMKAWEAEMRRLGYHNLVHYTGASWIDVNGLGYKGPVDTGQFGLKNFWIAQYPYSYEYMSQEQASIMSLHAGTAAWQFTSSSPLLPGRSNFDVNIDYRGRFTQ